MNSHILMRFYSFLFSAIIFSVSSHAENSWFNLVGDATNPAVNTVDVDPTPVSVTGDLHAMRLRVSRSEQRTNRDGVVYRSYVAQVVVDCAMNTARYETIRFYSEPIWSGEPYKVLTYSKDGKEPGSLMTLLGITPNPTQRIIHAVCQSRSVTSN